jgi:uncharacterized iron-regulated membrane protein
MKVFPVAVLVLLAFAAFFMTFLVAPLAVLTIFYVAYSLKAKSADKEPPAAPEPRQQWGAEPIDDEPEPESAPPTARRARVTVESHRERAAMLEAAAAVEAAAAEEAAAEGAEPASQATATATPDPPTSTGPKP